MWKLACACLVAFASVAAAEPVCTTRGPVLVQVDRIKDVKPPARQVTTIFESGGFTASDHKPGCVREPDLRTLRDALAKATWKVTVARFHCMAMSLVRTEYRVKGPLVWTAKLCSGRTLDKESAAAIDEVDRLVTRLVPDRAPIK